MDDLSAGLPKWLQSVQLAVDRNARFLEELAPCRHDGCLPRQELSLGNRPRAVVLVFPIRPTGMDEQHLDGCFANAVEQQSGAAFAHHLSRHTYPRIGACVAPHVHRAAEAQRQSLWLLLRLPAPRLLTVLRYTTPPE